MKMLHDVKTAKIAVGTLKCGLGVGDDAGRRLTRCYDAANVWDAPYG